MRLRRVLPVLLLLASPAQGQQALPLGVPIESDRPSFCVGMQLVPPGHLQVEGGLTLQRSGSSTPGVVGELSFRVPLSGRVELDLSTPSWAWQIEHDRDAPPDAKSEGFLDPSVGLKWRIVDGASWDVGLDVNVVVPLGTRGVGAPGLQGSALLVLEETFFGGTQLTLNAGWGSSWGEVAGAGARYGAGLGGASLEVPVSAPLALFAELFGWTSRDPGGPASGVVQAGLQWLATPRLMLDFRVGTGLGPGAPELVIGAGAGVLF